MTTKTKYDALLEGIRNRVTLKELDVLYCDYVVDCLGGNKVHAAKQLDVDRRTLQRWGIAPGGKAGRSKAEPPPQNPATEQTTNA